MNCTIAYCCFSMLNTDGAIYGVSDVCSFTQHDFPNDFNEGWSIHVKVISRSNTHICTCVHTHTHSMHHNTN
jgi:hypothetical protein